MHGLKGRGWRMTLAVAGVVTFLSSCIGMKYVTLEQMIPPPIVVPTHNTRLAVLNNCSPYNIPAVRPDVRLIHSAGDSLMEHTAQGLADADIFAEIVVLDSCLYPANDTLPHTLSQQEVQQLCHNLDVDLLLVCDYGGIACAVVQGRTIFHGSRYYMPCHLYAPSRETPLRSLMFESGFSRRHFRGQVEIDSVMHEVYDMLCMQIAKSFQPVWEERERNFFDGHLYDLREATVCVKDGDWDGAMMHWQRVGEKHSDRYKLMALYNEALYHEMVDSVGKSIDCLNKAMEYVTTTAEQDSVKLKHWLDSYGSLDGYKFTDRQLIGQYQKQLAARQNEVQQLNILNK